MAGTRNYSRDSHGRFHGSAGAAKVTTGKAGGFANHAFRTRVGQKASMSKSFGMGQHRTSRTSKRKKGVAIAAVTGGMAIVAIAASRR